MSSDVTFKGEKIRLSGQVPNVGEQAPDFQLVDQSLNDVMLTSLGSSHKLLNIFPSLDTGVCATALQTFYKKIGDTQGVQLLNISMDLPFAAKRFCDQSKLSNAAILSAFRSTFPDDYGLKIMDGPLKGLCARVVLVLDNDNTLVYREVVPEITQEPDYAAALGAVP